MPEFEISRSRPDPVGCGDPADLTRSALPEKAEPPDPMGSGLRQIATFEIESLKRQEVTKAQPGLLRVFVADLGVRINVGGET